MFMNLIYASSSVLLLCLLYVAYDWARQEIGARYEAPETDCCIKCHRMGADLYYPAFGMATVTEALWAQGKADTAELLRRADLALAYAA